MVCTRINNGCGHYNGVVVEMKGRGLSRGRKGRRKTKSWNKELEANTF
jgi:hypothetical protein